MQCGVHFLYTCTTSIPTLTALSPAYRRLSWLLQSLERLAITSRSYRRTGLVHSRVRTWMLLSLPFLKAWALQLVATRGTVHVSASPAVCCLQELVLLRSRRCAVGNQRTLFVSMRASIPRLIAVCLTARVLPIPIRSARQICRLCLTTWQCGSSLASRSPTSVRSSARLHDCARFGGASALRLAAPRSASHPRTRE